MPVRFDAGEVRCRLGWRLGFGNIGSTLKSWCSWIARPILLEAMSRGTLSMAERGNIGRPRGKPLCLALPLSLDDSALSKEGALAQRARKAFLREVLVAKFLEGERVQLGIMHVILWHDAMLGSFAEQWVGKFSCRCIFPAGLCHWWLG